MKPIAEYIVSMSSDGRILSQGSTSETLKLDRKFERELRLEEELATKAGEEVEIQQAEVKESSDGKLIIAEEVEEGHVSWSARKSEDITSLVSQHPHVFDARSRDVSQGSRRETSRSLFLSLCCGSWPHGHRDYRADVVFGILGISVLRSPGRRGPCLPVSAYY